MKHDPGIFEEPDPVAEAAAIERARADVTAGRYHDHAVVKQWLQTWTSADYKPFHEWLAARNG